MSGHGGGIKKIYAVCQEPLIFIDPLSTTQSGGHLIHYIFRKAENASFET